MPNAVSQSRCLKTVLKVTFRCICIENGYASRPTHAKSGEAASLHLATQQ